jgi:hypothetical protein
MAASTNPPPVAVLVELLRSLAPLGEHEHELLLVVEEAVHVRRVCRHGTDLGQQHRKEGVALEEVLDGDVHLPRARVLLLDRLGDHRRVGRQGARVVGDEQRAAAVRHVLDALDRHPEPQVVEEVVEGPVHQALDPLGPPPVRDLALRLDSR